MRRRALVLASLVAMALLLWLAFAGEVTPLAGDESAPADGPRRAGTDAATSQVERRPEAAAQLPQRVELPLARLPPAPAGKLPADCRIRGHVVRGGRPVGNREVYALGELRRGGIAMLTTRTDGAGQYDLPVPGAGFYRVRVAWDGMTQVLPAFLRKDEPEPGTAAAHQDVVVTDQPVDCDLLLPASCLRITALDAATKQPLADVEVAMTWTNGIDLTGLTDQDGAMLANDLPTGSCTVSLALRGYRAPPPFTVDLVGPAEERQLVLEPACILDLRVCDESGTLLAADDAPAVEVVHTVTGTVYAARRFRPRLGNSRPAVVQFDNLAEGPYGVRVADALGDGNGEATVRFQSAVALAEPLVSVVPGRATNAEICVRKRSYVEIRGLPRDGGSASAALYVELFDPKLGLRRALPTPRRSLRNARPPQFAGYLAEGTYWLTFVGPLGQLHRESMQVPGEGMQRSFWLPW